MRECTFQAWESNTSAMGSLKIIDCMEGAA